MAVDEPQIIPGEPRKKRAKIVSACGECRRRKTKCDGAVRCKSCIRADVPCVYPTVSHAEDKRNHLSKAALEAIEDRLKAIEDMLHTILGSQSFVAELPAAAVSQFLNNKESPSPSLALHRSYVLPPSSSTPSLSSSSSSSSVSASASSSLSSSSTSIASSSYLSLLPSSHSASMEVSPPLHTTPSCQYRLQHHQHHQQQQQQNDITSPDVRLPSIHDLSVHSAYSSPPPLAEIKQEPLSTAISDLPPPLGYPPYYARNNGRSKVSSNLSNDDMLDSNKKRKRS